MLLRTTIAPRRDGTVVATVGDRRHTFAAARLNAYARASRYSAEPPVVAVNVTRRAS